MFRSGLSGGEPDPSCDPTRGLNLIMLSIATSIDATAVGFSLALLALAILLPCLAIGAVTFALSLAAIRLGGLVLLIVGLRILITHLLSA
jgi:putative Mn2+ efflux pump MntP